MLLNLACAHSEVLLGWNVWPSVAVGITDEANALNCLSLTSSPSPLSFAKTAPVAGQLTHFHEQQNIVPVPLPSSPH